MLPGWFGFGSAVRAWLDGGSGADVQDLRRMYRDWPFFRATLSNMEMVLAKSNIAIAERYAGLAPDKELRDRIFDRIRAEHATTVAALLEIIESDRLLGGNPQLAQSITDRFPYLDPLNHLQVDFLRQNRETPGNPKVLRGIQLTINGIAAGLRNSG